MNTTTQNIEMIEREALKDLHAAVPETVRKALGLQAMEIDDAFVSISAHDESILWNRALGLGVQNEARPQTIGAIHSAYQKAGVKRYFLHLYEPARTAEIDAALNATGLEQARGWMKFTRPPENPPKATTDLEIREIDGEHGLDMGRIVAAGFDLNEQSIPALAALPGREGWHVFMAFDGDQPAGCGSLFVKDRIGWCDWGATDPKFRQRGAQSALLATRVQTAIDMGCHTIATATGEDVPGDPQHSYHNIERMGFQPFKLRQNFAPPKA